jgi:arylformamidase
MPLLKAEDYPAQEPITKEAGIAYRIEALRRAEGVEGLDCPYGEDIYQRIALFVPPKPNGTVLAWMHGGGWTSGYKEIMTFMAPAYNEAGTIFASIGYRLAPRHVFPAGFDDAASGIRWLHQNVARHGGDPKRIFVGGFSSGGHYAAMLAVRRDWQAALDLPAGVIRGCLPVSGTYDFTPAGGLTPRPRFLGPDEKTDRAASPLYVIQGKPPPFLMANGSDDFPSIKLQSPRMAAALRAAGGDCECIVFEGCDHFRSSLATVDPDKPWRRRSLQWMSER